MPGNHLVVTIRSKCTDYCAIFNSILQWGVVLTLGRVEYSNHLPVIHGYFPYRFIKIYWFVGFTKVTFYFVE